MEKRIQLEKRGRKESQILHLNLDNCKSPNIVGLSDEYTALDTLSLINVGLTTLKGFPKLPKLKTLELSDNRISTGLNHLETSPNLVYLNLSGNKIKSLEELKPLQNFKQLAVLDLFNNEVTDVAGYMEKVFALIPSLKYLDGFDINSHEAPSDDDDDEVDDDDEEVDDEDEAGSTAYDFDEDDEEDEDDVGLANVYNDNLGDDGSDYEAGEEEEGDDDEYITDEDEGAGNADVEQNTSISAEDTANTSQQSRGKKKKT